MTYFESAEGETVSKERALQELSRHCVPETALLQIVGGDKLIIPFC